MVGPPSLLWSNTLPCGVFFRLSVVIEKSCSKLVKSMVKERNEAYGNVIIERVVLDVWPLAVSRIEVRFLKIGIQPQR
jgi:hypothetical protein